MMNEREFQQMRQRVAKLESMIQQLVQPKSQPRLIIPGLTNTVAAFKFYSHSSFASGSYPTSSAETFGWQIAETDGDFGELGIEQVSDTSTTTATCKWLQFTKPGAFMMHLLFNFDPTKYRGAGGTNLLFDLYYKAGTAIGDSNYFGVTGVNITPARNFLPFACPTFAINPLEANLPLTLKIQMDVSIVDGAVNDRCGDIGSARPNICYIHKFDSWG